ncbi:helix-turn-helix transcriptional regulator [Kitasatospora terrestris]|uniref:HTH luxR-type domain-containing protein n=1 Tax=Kitasatospora terrestris TaxID=258051 RepID=A0ABP9D7I6_9ACTN
MTPYQFMIGDRRSLAGAPATATHATGAGNRDIAAALSLSPRTVEHHVANTLRKLGTTRARLRGPGHPQRRGTSQATGGALDLGRNTRGTEPRPENPVRGARRPDSVGALPNCGR